MTIVKNWKQWYTIIKLSKKNLKDYINLYFINLIDSIISIKFDIKKYIFTLINNHIYIIKTYLKKWKSK